MNPAVSAASSAIQEARQGKTPYFEEGEVGDLAREDIVAGLPQWVALKRGWVYMAQNDAWPGLYKIGCTRRGVQQRMASLNRTGLITEWIPLVYWQVYDAPGLEARVHKQCEAFQHSFEMFKASPQELIAQAEVVFDRDRQAILLQLKELLRLEELAALFTVSRHLC